MTATAADQGRWAILASSPGQPPEFLDGRFRTRDEAGAWLQERRDQLVAHNHNWVGCNFYLVNLDDPMA